MKHNQKKFRIADLGLRIAEFGLRNEKSIGSDYFLICENLRDLREKILCVPLCKPLCSFVVKKEFRISDFVKIIFF